MDLLKVMEEELLAYLPEKYTSVAIQENKKVNGNKKGISVTRTDNLGICVYEDTISAIYEEHNCNLEETIIAVADLVQKEMANMPEFDLTPRTIIRQVISKSENKDLLENVPNRDFLDLSIIYRAVVSSSEEGIASTIITNRYAEDILHMTEEELYQAAIANEAGNSFARPMEDVLSELSGEEFIVGDSGLYVLTNRTKTLGANAMLNEKLLQTIAENLNCDFYILPSSIHEVLATKDDARPEELREMIREVNDTEVSPEDRLSYNLYQYDRESKKLTIA